MRSETRCQQEIKEIQKDLLFWRKRLESEADELKRKIIGNTIVGLEGQMEALEWVLKES